MIGPINQVGTRYRRTTYPLSGLLYCDLCGNKFQLKGSQKYNNLYYICGSNYRRKDACSNKLYLNQQRLEDSVMEEVNGKIMQRGFLESYFQIARKDLNQKAKDAQGQIRRLKSEIQQLEDRMKQMLRDMAETKIPRQMALQVLAEDQSTKEQLEAELKHHQGTNKFRMPDWKLIRQELEAWLQGIESKKIALHSLINQITVYANATLEVTYSAGYLTNQTRALDYTP